MVKCPKCGKEIYDTLRHIQSGINVYDCWVDGYGRMDYQHDEFEADGNVNDYCCPECGETICSGEERAVEFLRGD